MKRFLSLLFLLTACKGIVNNEVFVTKPELQPFRNYTDNSFNEPFFHEEHYGLYKNFQDSVEKQHRFTTETIVLVDTTKHYLTNCEAEIQGDSLVLRFTDFPFSSCQLGFDIVKRKDMSLDVQYHDLYAVTDSSFKLATYKPIFQKIFLDQDSYKKHQLLKGKLSLSVIRSQKIGEHEYVDTARIYGLIKTVVR